MGDTTLGGAATADTRFGARPKAETLRTHGGQGLGARPKRTRGLRRRHCGHTGTAKADSRHGGHGLEARPKRTRDEHKVDGAHAGQGLEVRPHRTQAGQWRTHAGQVWRRGHQADTWRTSSRKAEPRSKLFG